MFLDVAMCVIFSLAAALFAAIAAFGGVQFPPPSDPVEKTARPGATDAYLFFLLSSLVPLGAVALFGASTRRSQAVARFGLFYGAALAVGAAAIAGATVGPSMGGRGESDVARVIALALESAVMIVFGAYVGYRCHYLRRRCVATSARSSATEELGEAAPEDQRRAALLSDRYDTSELLTAHFRHALAWAQASIIIVVAMDINSNGGPVARPALASAVATSMVLPLFQEMLLASLADLRERSSDPELSAREDDQNLPSAAQRAACVLYVVLTVSSAVCQFAAGLVMPLIRLVIGLSKKRHGENFQPEQQNWMHRICGPDGGAHSDCTALALRTYLAICASIAICAYGAYVYARIAMNVGRNREEGDVDDEAEEEERSRGNFGDRCKIWCNALCGLPICSTSTSARETRRWRCAAPSSSEEEDDDA